MQTKKMVMDDLIRNGGENKNLCFVGSNLIN